MRWHPDVIRWAIAIELKPSSENKLLRDSGFMFLPHPNTLNTYTHAVQPGSGINADLLQSLYNDFDMTNLKGHETFINLIFDEMKVKFGFCFSRGTGKLVGFVDVHSLSEEMRDFEIEKQMHKG
ncbi:hypothetical protein HOLleu_10202 [Holothuria leucospilota]|uniref:Transposable element P transposase-like RNase H domain-containing protein n=1 Tax=Holothuria leucospilota TaxID=206669 RepID=A0A9Q1HFK1_HOLLE|nr:hypothetical protein HOLleu_10202 [Holothuria leucospilota]